MTFSPPSILTVKPASPASRAGLRPGDKIITCNDLPVRDWVDLLVTSSSSAISLSISRGPLRRIVNLKRRPGVHWGIELSGSSARSCRNKCIFCFIDQQPPGLRSTLAVKDDDVRYSFINGTYITLTAQQTDEAISRGFTSLHVSVQTTDPVLRGRMLGLPGPAEILPNIDKLAENGIEVQAQIVEVPGWNNGNVMESTISDLYSRNNVTTLGIVPVGLTKWRTGLEPLARPTRNQAEQTLSVVDRWRQKAIKDKGTPWIYPADEFYVIADTTIPAVDFYKESSLSANGIGLIAEMINQCADREFTGNGVIFTGTMAAPFITSILKGSDYIVLPVTNTLMGPMVSVAGLLSGKDVINAANEYNGQLRQVFLPGAMFNHDGFSLDEYTVESIQERIGKKVTLTDSIGNLL